MPSIHGGAILGAVMDAHPETVAVFVRRRMHCPGCAMAPFVTLAQAVKAYGVETQDLVDSLRAAAAAAARGERP